MTRGRRNPGKLTLILRRVCFSDKPPYLITLFLAVLLYFINNIINHEVASPVVCFSFENVIPENINVFNKTLQAEFDNFNGSHLSIEKLEKKRQRFILENISLDKSVKLLRVIIKFRDNQTAGLLPAYFFNENLIPVSPAAVQYVTGSKTQDIIRSGPPRDLIQFEISHFQPDTKYLLEYDMAINPKIDVDPIIYLDTDSTVRLAKKGWKENLLIHRFAFNIFLLVFTLAILTIYIIISYKSYEPEIPTADHHSS